MSYGTLFCVRADGAPLTCTIICRFVANKLGLCDNILVVIGSPTQFYNVIVDLAQCELTLSHVPSSSSNHENTRSSAGGSTLPSSDDIEPPKALPPRLSASSSTLSLQKSNCLDREESSTSTSNLHVSKTIFRGWLLHDW